MFNECNCGHSGGFKMASIPPHKTVTIPVHKHEYSTQNDIRTLLEMVASPAEPDFPEVENIADRNGYYFDEYGALQAKGEDE